jgi:hypothetical protein
MVSKTHGSRKTFPDGWNVPELRARGLVFAADKISKARELRLSVARARRDGATPPLSRRGSKAYRKLAHYRHCEELLESRLAGSPLVESLRHELSELALVERAELVGAR